MAVETVHEVRKIEGVNEAFAEEGFVEGLEKESDVGE